MPVFLNKEKSLINYKKLVNTKYFVDKSEILDSINNAINTTERYMCITRPRRFGKSSVVDMLGAYYTRTLNTAELFDNLNISSSTTYKDNLNKYNVIRINFNDIAKECSSYKDYISLIHDNILSDIKEIYPDLEVSESHPLCISLENTGDEFIFLFDEWDYIFSSNLFEENQNDFLEFLRMLLKDQSYVALAYMTGVLPIKKYSSTSSMNMFDEHTMLSDMIYGKYFGFTETEVKELCSKQDVISMKDLSDWYNGYLTETGIRLYNPRSVVKALHNGKCKSYWTNTGAMEEVSHYLKYNVLEMREDVVSMVSGEEIDLIIDEEFRAGQKEPRTKEEIYSAMIVLGFLSYHDGYIRIPNTELMKEFEKSLKDESFGYVSEIIESSREMLKATVTKDTDTITRILHDIHNSEIPILKYSDENSLSCVLTLAYLSARDTYRVEREEKSGKGYIDFSFHPRRKKDIAFIVELKKDDTTENALKQITEKEYIQKFRKENNGKEILAVAICYNSKTKEHECEIKTL